MRQIDDWRDNLALFSSPHEVASLLGGELSGRDGVIAPGPGHSPRDRSLRFWLDPEAPDGFRVHSFAGDDPMLCRDYVREKLGLPTWQPGATKTKTPAVLTANNSASGGAGRRQREKAQWVWERCRSANGTLPERYLASRGIHLPWIPESIRYLPPCPPKYIHPAMVSAFALTEEPEPGRLTLTSKAIVGVHLTFLRADGRGKAGTGCDKIMVGPSAGTPIVVATINDGQGLAITEGIECALSVHMATGLGAWAAGSATRLPLLADAVPAYVDLVTIVADSDDVGQHNARLLAERLARRRHAVDLQTCSDEEAAV
jgi:hypothetical protein